jgi:hypothetical protein
MEGTKDRGMTSMSGKTPRKPPKGREVFFPPYRFSQIAIRNATSLRKMILMSRKKWVKDFIGSHAGAWEPEVNWVNGFIGSHDGAWEPGIL